MHAVSSLEYLSTRDIKYRTTLYSTILPAMITFRHQSLSSTKHPHKRARKSCIYTICLAPEYISQQRPSSLVNHHPCNSFSTCQYQRQPCPDASLAFGRYNSSPCVTVPPTLLYAALPNLFRPSWLSSSVQVRQLQPPLHPLLRRLLPSSCAEPPCA